MREIRLFSVFIVALILGGLRISAQSVGSDYVQNLEGRYDRSGVVDRTVAAQYKDLGLVLVPPLFIDELLTCPKRGTPEDSKFIFRKQGADYVVLLQKAGVTCALSKLGSFTESPDGALLLHRGVTLTGEGSSPIHGTREDRLSKQKFDGAEWLVVATRIEWTRRSWFRSKKAEYRSLVRFRESITLP